MVSEKKIEFLTKQGFEKDVVNMFINCGADKHLLWFLTMHKKGFIENLNSENIKLVNSYLDKNQINKNAKYSEVLTCAKKFEQNERRKLNNKIYHFENGFYISILNPIDLQDEGKNMSNCVGSYEERVHSGEVGILALKQSNGKTVAHIEIKKNGLIGQNYAKSNSQLGKECWMMISEFFEKNSKIVDLSKMFGESYVSTSRDSHISEVILTIPTSVNMFIEDGIKKTEQINGFEVKRFIPFKNGKENAIKMNSQSEICDWIEKKKKEIINAYDELSAQVLSISASKLYLSDVIKERIFGDKKDAYLMKGDCYNISEIDPRYGQEHFVDAPMAPMDFNNAIMDMEEAIEPVPMNGDEEVMNEEFDLDVAVERAVAADRENEEGEGGGIEPQRRRVRLLRANARNVEIINMLDGLEDREGEDETIEAEEVPAGNYGLNDDFEEVEMGEEEIYLNIREAIAQPPEPFDNIVGRAVRI